MNYTPNLDDLWLWRKNYSILNLYTSETPTTRSRNYKKWLLLLAEIKQRWFSGRILACHAGGPGSIPGRCKLFESIAWFYHSLLVATSEESFILLQICSIPCAQYQACVNYNKKIGTNHNPIIFYEMSWNFEDELIGVISIKLSLTFEFSFDLLSLVITSYHV